MSEFTPDPDFDARARAAARELRQPPPPDGLRHLERARRNRRLAQGGGALAVGVLAVGGILAVTSRGDGATVATADSTVETSPATTPPASRPTTVPGVMPSPSPTAPTAPTSEAPTRGVTTVPAETSQLRTVWVGEKLAGYFAEDGGFVAATSGGEVPEGLLGEPIDLHSPTGDVITATPTVQGCSSVYLSPSPGWGVWATSGAPLDVGAGSEPDPNVVDAVSRDLDAIGLATQRPRILTGPMSADGAVDAYVVNFGSGDDAPTWIATWDDATGEFTTIEGDPDPSNALAMGMPLSHHLDLDADGDWEIVFALGDGWDVRELATNESLVFGDGHPCPQPPALQPASADALIGEWGSAGDPVLLASYDAWSDTVTARLGWCQLNVADAGDLPRLTGWPGYPFECASPEGSPVVGDVAVSLSRTGEILIDPDGDSLVIDRGDGSTLVLERLHPAEGLDLERGSVFGVRADETGRTDELIARLVERLGEPDHDTGWFTTPNPDPESLNCLAGMDTRTLWWGDLAVSLWPLDESGRPDHAAVWDWTLGALADEVRVASGSSYTPTPTGFVTDLGFGVGAAQTDVDARVGDRLNWSEGGDGNWWSLLGGRDALYQANNVSLTSNGETLTSISATRSFC